ncbi:hypothetical protein CW709_01395 [Candidatus Bathyarchaeota archaeon]|nr:MAG: hypothetical protein CW709_01395 [Candidatus Bathyarchaeota archaeon]
MKVCAVVLTFLILLTVSTSVYSSTLSSTQVEESFKSKLLQIASHFKWEKGNVDLILDSKAFVDGDYSDLLFDEEENKTVLEVRTRGAFSTPFKVCSFGVNDMEVRVKFTLGTKSITSEGEISLLGVNGSVYGIRIRSDGYLATYAGENLKTDYRRFEAFNISQYNDFRIVRNGDRFTVYINGVEFTTDVEKEADEHLVLSIRFIRDHFFFLTAKDRVRISWIKFDGEIYEDFTSSRKEAATLKAFISSKANIDDEATSMLLWFTGDSLMEAGVIGREELEDFHHYFLYLACKSDNAWPYTDMRDGSFSKNYQPLLHIQWVLGALQWLEERGVKVNKALKDYLGYLSIAAIDPRTGYQISGPRDEHPGGWPGPEKYHVKQMQSLPFVFRWALEKGEEELIERVRKTVDYKISTYITEDWDVICEVGLVASHEAMEFTHGIYLTWLLETDKGRKDRLWNVFYNLVKRYMTENVWTVSVGNLKFVCYRKGELNASDSYATWQIVFNAYLAGFKVEDLAPYMEFMYLFRERSEDPRVNNSWYYGYRKLDGGWLSFGSNTSYILPYAIYALNLTGYRPRGDTKPPAVKITYPDEGVKVSGTIEIRFIAKDDFGISRVEFLEDGKLVDWRTKTGLPKEVNQTWSWDTSRLSEGSHTIEVVAIDKGGNLGSHRVSVIVVHHVEESPVPTATPTATPTASLKPISTPSPSPPPSKPYITERYLYPLIGTSVLIAVTVICVVLFNRIRKRMKSRS